MQKIYKTGLSDKGKKFVSVLAQLNEFKKLTVDFIEMTGIFSEFSK